MWEITLVGKKEDIIHFAILEDKLKQVLSTSVLVAITSGKNSYCSIAISNKKQIGIAKHHILECIIKICKEEYFLENITSLGSNKMINEFILISLTYIDLHDEVDYASYVVKFTKIIHIRSLIRFRLKKLFLLWEKFVKYFNASFSRIVDDKIYLDFLKFIASNVSSKTEMLFIEECDKSIYILDKCRNVIVATAKTDELDLIVNLIVYAPKKVIINCLSSLSGNVCQLIKYIFEDKICVIL